MDIFFSQKNFVVFHVDGETTRPRISFAVFKNLRFCFMFITRTNQYHSLKFSQNFLRTVKKNHENFQEFTFVVFH